MALCVSITLGYVLILAPARENIETAVLKWDIIWFQWRKFFCSSFLFCLYFFNFLIFTPLLSLFSFFFFRFFQFTSEKSLKKLVFKNFVRTFLVICTALVAILAPYFGEMLGAVGGLTDALQSFVLPPLICLSMQYQDSMEINMYRKLFYFFVIFWGLGTILYTLTRLLNKI